MMPEPRADLTLAGLPRERLSIRLFSLKPSSLANGDCDGVRNETSQPESCY